MTRFKIFSVILTLLFLLSGCSEEKQASAPEKKTEIPPLPVEAITVKKEKVPIWIEFSGKTEASKRVDVRARVAGQLEEILFQEGDYVREGETLFIIEKEKYEASLAQAKAQLEQSRATLQLARKDVERYRPLVAEDLAPRATLEQYEARVAELEATIKSNEATIQEAELNLKYTDVKAPIAGRIGRRYVDTGNIVGYGQQTLLATIVADDPLYAYFSPSERVTIGMLKYKSGDQMDARVRIPERQEGILMRKPLTGKVDFSDNRVDPMTGTITMRAEVANPDHAILEGTFVYIEVMVTDQHAFMLIPPAAVQADQLGSYVYIVDGEGKAGRVNIKTGYESRKYLIVEEGLEGGEQLLISGFAKVRPGTKLSVTDVTDSKGIMALLAKQGMLDSGE